MPPNTRIPNASDPAVPIKDRDSQMADTGAIIQIQHTAADAAIVSVTYPDELRLKSKRGLIIGIPILCVIPAIFWLIFRNGAGEWFASIGSAVGVIIWIFTLRRQYLAVTQSCVFRADAKGLLIERSNGQNKSQEQYRKDQIRDIKLGFNHNRKSPPLFSCWMIIEIHDSWWSIKCLQNVGGDHLSRIANVLRAALGMPQRSWP
jgi:hypothetical protein